MKMNEDSCNMWHCLEQEKMFTYYNKTLKLIIMDNREETLKYMLNYLQENDYDEPEKIVAILDIVGEYFYKEWSDVMIESILERMEIDDCEYSFTNINEETSTYRVLNDEELEDELYWARDDFRFENEFCIPSYLREYVDWTEAANNYYAWAEDLYDPASIFNFNCPGFPHLYVIQQ